MESYTRYIDEKKFETLLGSYRIVTDQTKQDGGSGAGPTPPELLLASLGACAGHYAAEYLRARSLPLSGLQIQVHAEKGGRPVRLASFRVQVSLPDLEERHRLGLLRSVKSCLIHNTLESEARIEVEMSASRGFSWDLSTPRGLDV
jgi:uncharacterized OsmC-like protein